MNPLPVPAQPEGIVLNEAALHFALDRAEVPPQGLEVLKEWAGRIKALKQPPVLSVSGYTDATGRRAHNVHLSQARAQAVAEVLKAEGLAVDRVEGLGPDHPIASNETPEGRAKNRRVEIRLEGVQARGQVSSDPVTEHAEPRKILKKRP
jgi:OOP family OmpA-OmpF porin